MTSQSKESQRNSIQTLQIELDDGTSENSMYSAEANLSWRQIKSKVFARSCAALAFVSLLLLIWLLVRVWTQGSPWLSLDFLNSFPSRIPARAGVKSALIGSGIIILITALLSITIGIAAAIFLEELSPRQSKLSRLIELSISNLAGVPSLVYGILGLALFVRTLNMGRSFLAAGATLAIMILPVIILTSREALRTIPVSIRQAAYALGATPWQTVSSHVLPAALPQILTGIILALSRALGEAAPLIIVGGVTYIAFLPESIFDSFTTLPIQIYNWAGRPQEDFQSIAAAGIIVLLTLVLVTNMTAILLRVWLDQRNKFK
jgi:phosphate transport system permease protein